MKAIILAAGQGTRLRPLTDDRPKCLVELAGKSLLDHHVAALRASGIEDIVVVGGYRAEMLARDGLRTVVNPDFATTNMVATLFTAAAELDDGGDIMIGYGDCVYEPRVVAAVLHSNAPIALAVDVAWRRYWEMRMDDPLADAETLRLDASGAVVELGKKPQGYDQIEGQYMGLFKIRADHAGRLRDIWDGLDPDALYDGKDRGNMYMTSFVQHLIDIGWQVQSVPVENGWLEIDTVADLEQCEALQAAGELARFCELGAAGA